jgi:hypothetical protein
VRTDDGAAALAGPFIAMVMARGARGPVRLLDDESRGWPLIDREGDTLVVDEFGDLWWTRSVQAGELRIVRTCWPEEARALLPEIRQAFHRMVERIETV